MENVVTRQNHLNKVLAQQAQMQDVVKKERLVTQRSQQAVMQAGAYTRPLLIST
jgi:hypothetical protein